MMILEVLSKVGSDLLLPLVGDKIDFSKKRYKMPTKAISKPPNKLSISISLEKTDVTRDT